MNIYEFISLNCISSQLSIPITIHFDTTPPNNNTNHTNINPTTPHKPPTTYPKPTPGTKQIATTRNDKQVQKYTHYHEKGILLLKIFILNIDKQTTSVNPQTKTQTTSTSTTSTSPTNQPTNNTNESANKNLYHF